MKSLLFTAFIFIILTTNSKAQFTLHCDSFCVTNIQMSAQPGYLDVTIYNANAGHINYPTVKVCDANGDTIADDNNQFTFFAQLGGTSQTYLVPASVTSLPPNFTGTVLLTENIWDTTCFLPYPCTTLNAINATSGPQPFAKLWPVINDGYFEINPALTQPSVVLMILYNSCGKQVLSKTISYKPTDGNIAFRCAWLPPGFYVMRLSTSYATASFKMIKR